MALPPGRARLSTKPAPTGSATAANTIGNVAAHLPQWRQRGVPTGQNDVRREGDQFGCVFAYSLGDRRRPSDIDPNVAADRPARLLQPLLKRGDAGLRFAIVRGDGHEHADPPHAFGLLRPRRERPRCRRTAEQRDELAPSYHSITSSARASSVGGTVEAERLGGLEVDRPARIWWADHRKVGRLLALENPADISARLPELAI